MYVFSTPLWRNTDLHTLVTVFVICLHTQRRCTCSLPGYLTNAHPAAFVGEYINASWRRDLRFEVGFSYDFTPTNEATNEDTEHDNAKERDAMDAWRGSNGDGDDRVTRDSRCAARQEG